MGGRGSSSALGSGGASLTKSIKEEFLEFGLNSKMKGIQRDAREGKGFYSWKAAKPISEKQLKKMEQPKLYERNGKTLVFGRIGQKDVVYGNKTDSKQIQGVKKQIESSRAKAREVAKAPRPENRTETATYEKWLKRKRQEGLDRYFGSGKMK